MSLEIVAAAISGPADAVNTGVALLLLLLQLLMLMLGLAAPR